MGEGGWDWDTITRLDLDLTKDVDVLIVSTDQEVQDSEMKAKRRTEALAMVDPLTVNPKWKSEQVLKSIGDYSDEEVAEALDVKTYSDRKSIARASVAIEMILRDETPEQWHGATTAFIQKITDFASDRRSTLGEKFQILIDYAMSHVDIVRGNIERKVAEEAAIMGQQNMAQGNGQVPVDPNAKPSQAENPGMSGGMSRAMSIAEEAV